MHEQDTGGPNTPIRHGGRSPGAERAATTEPDGAVLSGGSAGSGARSTSSRIEGGTIHGTVVQADVVHLHSGPGPKAGRAGPRPRTVMIAGALLSLAVLAGLLLAVSPTPSRKWPDVRHGGTGSALIPAFVPNRPDRHGETVGAACRSGAKGFSGIQTVTAPDGRVLGWVNLMANHDPACGLVWAEFDLNKGGYGTMNGWGGAGIARVDVTLDLGKGTPAETTTWGDTSARYDPDRVRPADPPGETVESPGANACLTNAVIARVLVTMYPDPAS
ncbi:hypothetical protein PUR71_04490 [Streptomyces sp. SP17BM10]|uniref:hypothetical protein n=1 Tax=Streptomyces sp. SP17BM10 TaxID=3002530 RepID=UPI002E7926B5|nr:hypothetical protein [Streptomyces sp. SP17BM10]MEE1782189.1 hypothetical protein [Streptomyces sp. SP17BM10]